MSGNLIPIRLLLALTLAGGGTGAAPGQFKLRVRSADPARFYLDDSRAKTGKSAAGAGDTPATSAGSTGAAGSTTSGSATVDGGVGRHGRSLDGRRRGQRRRHAPSAWASAVQVTPVTRHGRTATPNTTDSRDRRARTPGALAHARSHSGSAARVRTPVRLSSRAPAPPRPACALPLAQRRDERRRPSRPRPGPRYARLARLARRRRPCSRQGQPRRQRRGRVALPQARQKVRARVTLG